MVENSRGKRHLTIVVCRRFCSRLNNKTASERSQGLLFLQSSGMLASPLGVAAYICTLSGNEGGEGMRQIFYGMAVASLGLAVVVTFPHAAWSYPSFQRLPYVSDAEPFCAGCHSSFDASYQPELPPEASQAQVYTTKHYKALEEGTFPGKKPQKPESGKSLLNQPRTIAQNASVQLQTSAPTVAPGGSLTVTVTTKGGIGPVVGIMLLDEPLRFQARPIQGTGWFITGAPEVIGPDGKPQNKWLDRRSNKQQT